MTDHIVINVETGKYECQHCGATQSPPKMPVLIRDMLAHIDMFTAAHRDCKSPTDASPPPTEYEQGNVITYKGNSSIGDKGDTNTIKATIKEHTIYNDIQQTIIQRPRVLEVA